MLHTHARTGQGRIRTFSPVSTALARSARYVSRHREGPRRSTTTRPAAGRPRRTAGADPVPDRYALTR